MQLTTLLLGLLLAFSRAGVGSCSALRTAQPWHPHLARVRVPDGAPALDRRVPEPLEGAPSLLQLGQGGPGCNCQGQQQAAAPAGQQGLLQAGPGLPGFAQAYFDAWGPQQAPQHAPQQLPQMPLQAQALPPAAEPQAAQGFFAPPTAQEAPAIVPLPDAGMALPAAQPGMLQYDQAAAAADASQPPPPCAREGPGQQRELAQEALLAQRQEVLQLRQQVGLMEQRMEQMEAAALRQGGQEAFGRAPPPPAPLRAAVAEGGASPLPQGPLQEQLMQEHLLQEQLLQGPQEQLLQGPFQEGFARALPPQAPFQAVGGEGSAPPLLQSPLQAGLPVWNPAAGEGLALGQLQQMAAAQPAYVAAAEQQLLQRAARERQMRALQAQQLAEQAALAQAMPQAMPQAQLLDPWGKQRPLEAVPAAVPFVLR